MKKQPKQDVVTFKADKILLESLDAIPNRSEFIRNAILAALDNSCPFCQGTGILSPHQKKNWLEIMKTHSIEKCDDCDSIIISCSKHEHKAKKENEK